jgi:selenide, water dikinase
MKNLVLIGGGHSHIIVLWMFLIKPLSGISLTLISDSSHTPYSGMLPGHIAGFYTHKQFHIDLSYIANLAGAEFLIDRVVGLDLEKHQVFCANHLPVEFDILSIDIGSIPATLSIPGAKEYAIPAKPVDKFLEHWHQISKNINPHTNPNTINHTNIFKDGLSLGIVGGGAGGVELALSMQGYFQKQKLNFRENDLLIHLFQRDRELMPSFPRSVRKMVKRILQHRGVELHLGESVCQVKKIVEGYCLICESGLVEKCDYIFWVTQASAQQWLKQAGLATDNQGFILVDENLQSLSHPGIFAAGDIATMVNHPLPKAGVFAVRQSKPLFENLVRSLLGKKLKPYKPQKNYLSLIGTGDGKAFATRGKFVLPPSKLLWWWKDYIDRQFMEKFRP